MAGVTSARSRTDALIREHDWLVRFLARRWIARGLPRDEATQAGRIGLWKASGGFDPERGVRFTTYAGAFVAAELRRAHAFNNAWPFGSDDGGECDGEASVAGDPDRDMDVTCRIAALGRVLPEKHVDVMLLVLGEGLTAAEVGRRLHISRARVGQILQRVCAASFALSVEAA